LKEPIDGTGPGGEGEVCIADLLGHESLKEEENDGYRTYIEKFESNPVDAIKADQYGEQPPGVFRWEERGVAPPLIGCQ